MKLKNNILNMKSRWLQPVFGPSNPVKKETDPVKCPVGFIDIISGDLRCSLEKYEEIRKSSSN